MNNLADFYDKVKQIINNGDRELPFELIHLKSIEMGENQFLLAPLSLYLCSRNWSRDVAIDVCFSRESKEEESIATGTQQHFEELMFDRGGFRWWTWDMRDERRFDFSTAPLSPLFAHELKHRFSIPYSNGH